MTRDFSLRAWDPISGHLAYDILVSRGKVYTADLSIFGEEKDLDIHRCTGLLDVNKKALWEKDLVAAIIRDPNTDKPLKESTNFHWVAGTKADGTFTKIFQIRYSLKNASFYLFPFEAPEGEVKETSCFYIQSVKGWEVIIKKLCSPNDLVKKAKELTKELEQIVKVEGRFR